MNYCFIHKIWHDTPVCPKDPVKEIKLDEKGENKDDREFHKKIGIINLKAMVASTLGSILISVGLAFVLFSYTVSQNPSTVGNPIYLDYAFGLIMFAMGIGILIGSLSKKNREIKEL